VHVESGIYILGRDPLEMRAWIYAPEILRAILGRFADADPGSRNLEITWWSLTDNRRIDQKILNLHDGCLARNSRRTVNSRRASIPRFAEIYRTDTGEQIVAER